MSRFFVPGDPRVTRVPCVRWARSKRALTSPADHVIRSPYRPPAPTAALIGPAEPRDARNVSSDYRLLAVSLVSGLHLSTYV